MTSPWHWVTGKNSRIEHCLWGALWCRPVQAAIVPEHERDQHSDQSHQALDDGGFEERMGLSRGSLILFSTLERQLRPVLKKQRSAVADRAGVSKQLISLLMCPWCLLSLSSCPWFRHCSCPCRLSSNQWFG